MYYVNCNLYYTFYVNCNYYLKYIMLILTIVSTMRYRPNVTTPFVFCSSENCKDINGQNYYLCYFIVGWYVGSFEKRVPVLIRRSHQELSILVV